MRVFCFISLLLCCLSCSNDQQKILPVERELTEAVYSSVTIQPDSLYKVYANVSGILDVVLVQEGYLVKKGDTLFQINNNTPKLNTQNANVVLDLAKQNYSGNAAILKGIEDDIKAAELKYKNDSVNYFRQKRLWDQNIGSKSQYDAKKLNYELASNQLSQLKDNYQRAENELLSTLKQAENNYKSSFISTGDFTVESKINGKIYAIYKEPGEIITISEPIASVGSANRFIIEMLVDEVDIVKISKSQNVLIHLDAYNDTIFKGNISKIYPKKDERNQTFKVEANFIDVPETLYPGLSGEASIIIAKRTNVLTIPKAYIINDSMVKTEDGLVKISTGLESMEYVEVLSGITKNTYIYKSE